MRLIRLTTTTTTTRTAEEKTSPLLISSWVSKQKKIEKIRPYTVFIFWSNIKETKKELSANYFRSQNTHTQSIIEAINKMRFFFFFFLFLCWRDGGGSLQKHEKKLLCYWDTRTRSSFSFLFIKSLLMCVGVYYRQTLIVLLCGGSIGS